MNTLTAAKTVSESISPDDRRTHARKDFQTVVTILLPQPGGDFRLARGWSQDVSLGGAKVISREDLGLKGDREVVYLRFLSAEMGAQTIQAEVLRTGRWEKKSFLNQTIASFFQYQVRFTQLVTDSEILDRFGAACQPAT